ncbi:SDR family NAD(P)-dependent oxidoreductase [Shinella fusca]|uniref:UDP-glucuronate 4-epimerase n=1 Tax=Shinella fusca TaxID=544480 RepID=A0A7W8DXV2_9HYPH|nr:SDR family NAD(P)-dependent oxidoreductase [Shinella fusca]MBB5045246.1 UDP-glucuronate 4-epimerase [Shinella fusca]
MSSNSRKRSVLITGGAGFIGYHLAKRMLDDDWRVVSVDGMTNYYDPSLKRRRHEMLAKSNHFQAHEVMLEDFEALSIAFADAQPDIVVHLAAQAGVRYSLENPRAYVEANLVGTFNVMELVRQHKPAHYLFASTSSVYGANKDMPFGETDRTDHPITLYAATKKATENMAHSYAHLWSQPTTAFRFFTVYGPWGRPDMALFKFVRAMQAGEAIDVYGEGDMRRDFTYVDDLIESIVRLIEAVPATGQPIADAVDSLSPAAPFRVVNIGGGQPVGLMDFISTIEQQLGLEARKNILPMQAGDVRETYAKAELLEALTGYRPSTTVEAGIKAFVDWYLSYYQAK